MIDVFPRKLQEGKRGIFHFDDFMKWRKSEEKNTRY